jgi:hypothetical protein
VQDRFKQKKRPTLKQTKELLDRLEAAEALIGMLQPAFGDVEKERDAYALLARSRSEMLEHLYQTSASTEPSDDQPLDGTQEHTLLPQMQANWHYNLREFFEASLSGWRAIVSSDSADDCWIAYVERGEVRFYADHTFVFVQDALAWCEAEMLQRTDTIDTQAPQP